jgi:hypothetical protein
MAASLNVAIVDGAPGNVIQIAGAGLVPGGPANVTINNQGVSATPGLTPQTISLPAVFSTTSVSIGPLPDGINSGTLTVTAGDDSQVTCSLRAVSQYVQSSEYIGEGEPTSSLAPGELDAILQRASAMCDAYMGGGLRKLQVLERHKYKDRPNGAPLIFPYRTRGRRVPIASVDQLTFVSAVDLVTVFYTTDMYLNQDLNYIEILAYAVGNYALLAQLQIIGYSANVFELAYTSGYTMAAYPDEVRTATLITATMLLNRRRRQSMGMGPFKAYKGEEQLEVDPISVKLPRDARVLLAPYVALAVS